MTDLTNDNDKLKEQKATPYNYTKNHVIKYL